MLVFNDYISVIIINIYVITTEKYILKNVFILQEKKWIKALIHFSNH